MAAYCTGSDPIEIGDLESKVKVTVTQNPFFFYTSVFVNFNTVDLCSLMSNQNEIWYVA